MPSRVAWLSLCLLASAVPATAGDPRNCATPSSTFRHYHRADDGDEAAARAATYDEISVCRTASGSLSFALSVSGEGADRCYVEGQAKPRQKDVFVFLDGGFRLRIELRGDRLRVSERSETGAAGKYCDGSATIGSVEFKRRSGQPPAN